jgi:hypothetical protein
MVIKPAWVFFLPNIFFLGKKNFFLPELFLFGKRQNITHFFIAFKKVSKLNANGNFNSDYSFELCRKSDLHYNCCKMRDKDFDALQNVFIALQKLTKRTKKKNN